MAEVDTRSVIRLAGQGIQPLPPPAPPRSYVVVAAEPARAQPGAPPGDPEVAREPVSLLRMEVDDAGGPGNLLTPVPADLEPNVHRRPAQIPTIPPAPGGLIGRRPEILAVRAALEPGAAVGLYGSPGVGKTTVVRQLAAELEGSDRSPCSTAATPAPTTC